MNGFHSEIGHLSSDEPALPEDPEAVDAQVDEDEDDEQYESETDESFDRQAFGIYQQLPVPHGVPDPNREPQTAEEYLQRVRYEAAQLPDTMISALDATQYDEQRTSYVDAHSTPSIQFKGLRPDWIQGFVKDFAVLRADLESQELPRLSTAHLPALDDAGAWKTFCLGNMSQPGLEVTAAFVKSLDQLFLRRLLRWHSIWLTEDSRRLDTLQMQWIYSLAAAMDEVFPMGTAATLRDMLRHCAKLSIEPRDETELINIHIVIAVAGVYFKQGEQLAAPLQ